MLNKTVEVLKFFNLKPHQRFHLKYTGSGAYAMRDGYPATFYIDIDCHCYMVVPGGAIQEHSTIESIINGFYLVCDIE